MSALGVNQFDDNAELAKENMSLRIPAEFKSVAHAVAVNEHRNNFHSRSIFLSAQEAEDSNGKANSTKQTCTEKGFMGTHADIGGGCGEGDLASLHEGWVGEGPD